MFTYPALLWFLPILGAVILIHLINMLRHRRVEWGAMEFILASYKKSRTRILLQQLLLMLLRTAAVAAIILMFAHPTLEGELAQWFGNRGTHHIILLDDSYSMNERNLAQGGTLLFEEAIAVIRQIAEGRANDRLTLVRLSSAEPVLHELLLNADGLQTVQNLLPNLQPSSFAHEPEIMLTTASDLVRQTVGLNPVVYFLSDFRRRNWENPTPMLEQIETIRQQGGTVRMIRIAQAEQPNLGIEDIHLVEGIHAADIDVLLDATIVNYGSEAANNVLVTLFVDDQMRAQQTVPRIPPGGRTVPPLRFPVRLEGTRQHRVEVRLQPDALPDDNHRFMALQVPDALEVLLIAPTSSTSAQHVRVALAPGGTRSGIRVRQELPTFLVAFRPDDTTNRVAAFRPDDTTNRVVAFRPDDATDRVAAFGPGDATSRVAEQPLRQFSAIFVTDLPTLEPAAVRALENYVAEGGGVAFFLGDNTDLDFVRNHLYRDGNGLFPASPITVEELMPDFLTRVSDVRTLPHPIFRLFGDGESPLLGTVAIDRYLAIEPVSDPAVNIWAMLRNDAPLVLEKTYGEGRTMTFLTTASPTWNNWARNPSYVVVLLELAAWLSRRPEQARSFLVGDPFEIEVDPMVFGERVRVVSPPRERGEGREGREGREGESSGISTSVDAISGLAMFTNTNHPGFYTVYRTTRMGTERSDLFAVNVSASEGDIRQLDVTEISDILRRVRQPLETAASFSMAGEFLGQQSISDWLLYAVILFLLGEIFLAGRILPPSRRWEKQ